MTAVVVAGALVRPFHDTVTTSVNGASHPGAWPWWTWPGSTVLAVLAALVVVGYLAPRGSGRLLATGCTPCAVVPAGSVLGAFLILDSIPSAGGMLTAVALIGSALLQRLVPAAGTCALGVSAGGAGDGSSGTRRTAAPDA